MTARGVQLSAWDLFAGNVVYNVVLGAIIVFVFGKRTGAADATPRRPRRPSIRAASPLPTPISTSNMCARC